MPAARLKKEYNSKLSQLTKRKVSDKTKIFFDVEGVLYILICSVTDI